LLGNVDVLGGCLGVRGCLGFEGGCEGAVVIGWAKLLDLVFTELLSVVVGEGGDVNV